VSYCAHVEGPGFGLVTPLVERRLIALYRVRQKEWSKYNTNNILLRVNNDSFSTLQVASVLEFVLHCFTSCVQCLLGGHHPRVF
jgi:hypothetical protein